MPTLFQPETERLRLRQWREADREKFAALNADPEVMRHYPKTLSPSESDALFERLAALIADRGWGFWAVERKDTARFIGYVGLHIPSAELPFKPCVEVGWRLARSAWGQGYATEAARAALEFGFTELGLQEIVSFTTLDNRRSRAVMERLGMQRDPHNFQHPNLAPGSPLREHCLYRLPAARWRELQGESPQT